MSLHSYSSLWVHLIWETRNREPLLPKPAAARVSGFLKLYALEHKVFMAANYVNADHVHALIDLPAEKSVAEIVGLLKGASSHWINHDDVIRGKFAWGHGYGAFSVSPSQRSNVMAYITGQEEHHRVRTFSEEYARFVKEYGMDFSSRDSERQNR